MKKPSFKGTSLTELTQNYNRAIANATTEKDLTVLLDEISTGYLFDAKDRAYFKSEIELRRRELKSNPNNSYLSLV